MHSRRRPLVLEECWATNNSACQGSYMNSCSRALPIKTMLPEEAFLIPRCFPPRFVVVPKADRPPFGATQAGIGQCHGAQSSKPCADRPRGPEHNLVRPYTQIKQSGDGFVVTDNTSGHGVCGQSYTSWRPRLATLRLVASGTRMIRMDRSARKL